MKSSAKDIFWALAVRLMLTLHTFIAYWRTVDVTGKEYVWYFLILNVLVFAETIYRIKVKRGKEGKWFCPCFLFYLICTVPAIYILELDKVRRYNLILATQNITVDMSLSSILGVTLPITLNPNIWVSVIEQAMLFLMILARWLLPRGNLSRDKLSQLLFAYISMASDNMELFVLFDEAPVRTDTLLTYGILAVWTFSLFQFSMVLTATRSEREKSSVSPSDADKNIVKKESVLVGCFKTELWSLMLSFVCQDGPYLSIRLYTMISYQLITYSIIFFTFKNMFVILLFLYRLYAMHFNQDDDELGKEDFLSTPERSRQKSIRQHRQSTGSLPRKETNGYKDYRRSTIMEDGSLYIATERYGRQPSPKSKKLSIVSLDI